MKKLSDAIQLAAQSIEQADALLIATGAGMGVDSGLPDFRGNEGFWKAYPVFKHLGYSFIEMANPSWFEKDAMLAWGFYGHRYNLYQTTQPHPGFEILRQWGEWKGNNIFVFTSNVDGHFQKAGFQDAQVYECHGSIRHLQCTLPCNTQIWPMGDHKVTVDSLNLRAASPLPQCSVCQAIARPNVLMFGDWNWVDQRTAEQEKHYQAWLGKQHGKLTIIECGAGKAVPTVRHHCESIAQHFSASFIRINPREPEGPEGTISLKIGGLAALKQIQEYLNK